MMYSPGFDGKPLNAVGPIRLKDFNPRVLKAKDSTIPKETGREAPLSRGDLVTSPAGRRLLVKDVFVPRSNRMKSQELPARFRTLSRKVVLFKNGSVAPLQEIQANYTVVA